MHQTRSQRSKATIGAYDAAISTRISQVERREWWLWSAAVLVTLLLTLGMASFVFFPVLTHVDASYWFNFGQALRALVALVLLFDVYAIYQQLQIHVIRRRLIEREELFRLISENAADMIALVDTHGRRLYSSPAYQKVLGYSPEELMATPAFEQIHPDDRQRVMEAEEEARRLSVGRTIEYRMRHKEGNWLTLESTPSAIRNAKGEVEKLVILNRDISERKWAEEAQRRSEANFRSLVQNAPYGIYRCTVEGTLVQVNPALVDMLGYESERELVNTNIGTDIYCEPSEYKRWIEQCREQEKFKGIEAEWRRKDGSPMTVRCSGRRVLDERGAVAFFEVIAEDVTERRALEHKLRQAQKMEAVGRLSGGIAHDFNNLLGVIIGYSEVLEERLDKGNALRTSAEEITKAGHRAAALTRQLLAFSRQQVLEPRVLDLNAVVADTEKMLRRLIGEDIELTSVLDPTLGRIKADQMQIEQVIMNLAVNARDAMPQGGKLILETSNAELDDKFAREHPPLVPGHYVLLAVTDTGIGMDAETQARIFEPFFTTKERGKGTGLGLATVYGVVKQSGGYIWVYSELGEGTTFKIFLPQIDDPVVPQGASKAQRDTLVGSETVLVVEDAEPLRKLARQLLEGNGYTVLEAPAGAEAIHVAEQHPGPIHLLLTDVVMPGMGGRALAQELTLRRPEMKVLYMSGYTDHAIASRGDLEPGTFLLQKPFTREMLTRKVREVLDAQRIPTQA